MNSKILSPDLGLLLLRVSTGALMLFHGIAKLSNGFGEIKEILADKGLPIFLWIGVPLTEIIAPVLLMLGIFGRLSGLSIALLMAMTIIIAHASEAFSISEYGGLAVELNLLYLFSGLTIFFTGGGKYCLRTSKNEWLR